MSPHGGLLKKKQKRSRQLNKGKLAVHPPRESGSGIGMVGIEHIRASPNEPELARRNDLIISVRVSNFPLILVVADLAVREAGATHRTRLGGFTPRMQTGGMKLVVASRK